jgi:hypothetical protein
VQDAHIALCQFVTKGEFLNIWHASGLTHLGLYRWNAFDSLMPSKKRPKTMIAFSDY